MHRVAQEEVFGPVLSAMSFKDEDHAIELANATEFGLVAGIWTRDGGRQFRMAKRVRSGQVFINNYGAGGRGGAAIRWRQVLRLRPRKRPGSAAGLHHPQDRGHSARLNRLRCPSTKPT